jgi:hypothetical protein
MERSLPGLERACYAEARFATSARHTARRRVSAQITPSTSSNALLGGTAIKTLPMPALFVSRPKCPHAQAAGNDYGNPGTPHRHVDTSHIHRPLIQSPYSLKNGYHTEDST